MSQKRKGPEGHRYCKLSVRDRFGNQATERREEKRGGGAHHCSSAASGCSRSSAPAESRNSPANSATPCSWCTRCCSCCTCYSNSPLNQTRPGPLGGGAAEERRRTALAQPWMRPAERENGRGIRRRVRGRRCGVSTCYERILL